jgi:hypothetical protein
MPKPAALQGLDLETLRQHMVQRVAQEVIAHAPQLDRLQQALDRPDDPVRAADVLDEQQRAARAQNSHGFAYGGAVVGDGTQRVAEDDGIEVLVGVGEGRGIALAQSHVEPEVTGAPLGQADGHAAEVDPGQPYVPRVVGQGSPPADADLQRFAIRPGAEPLASGVAALRARAGGSPIVDPADSLRFGVTDGHAQTVGRRACHGKGSRRAPARSVRRRSRPRHHSISPVQ